MTEEKEKKNKGGINKSIYLQFHGMEVSLEEIEKQIMSNYDSVKNGNDKPEDIRIYLKPEDEKVYYVINSDFAGAVDMLLK